MYPLVSVVMPAYNGEKYINTAIESIVEQTYSQWELIIVDDASDDNTFQIIKHYLDPRIKVLQNNSNCGISYTTNKAIANSSGKYIALLDDDDMATSKRLELQVEYLEKNEDIDILGGRSVCIDEEGKFLKHEDSAPLYNPKMIKAWMHFSNRRFSNGTTMIRKAFIDKYGIEFKDGYYGIQDFKYMADCSKVGNISSIDRILQKKRIHANEATNIYLSNNSLARAKSYEKVQRESIIDSGFRIDENKMRILNAYLPENPQRCLTREETIEMICVFNEMIYQAQEMQIDYLTELKIVCKKIIIERAFQCTEYDDLINYFQFDNSNKNC